MAYHSAHAGKHCLTSHLYHGFRCHPAGKDTPTAQTAASRNMVSFQKSDVLCSELINRTLTFSILRCLGLRCVPLERLSSRGDDGDDYGINHLKVAMSQSYHRLAPRQLQAPATSDRTGRTS